MPMLLLVLKSAFTKIASGVAFAIERWRIFLPILIVGLTLWYVHALRSDRDAAVSELRDYKLEIDRLAAEREADNLAKEKEAKAKLSTVLVLHAAELETIRRQANERLKDEQKKSADADRAIADLRSRLRDAVKAGSARVPLVPRPAETATGSGGDCDPASIGPDSAGTYIDALEAACAITTSDYNALWNSWQEACRVYGCGD